ncbi:FAD-dependent oxidoreductase [Candidatus Saccharibacteria bacterium]|nr:FAD-dependent oxidoreductase [Candidatus Saccharibacteria bacterium]
MLAKYKLVKNQNITPSIISLSLERAVNQPMISFQPGQYATISYYKHGRRSAERCFSIASSPTSQNGVEFGIRVAGKFTQALQKLPEGSTMLVRGPYGGFVFDAQYEKRVVLCAGGIGITPFMSMIRYAAATGIDNEITLIYSIRNQDEIAYYDELNEIITNHKNIRVFFIIGEGTIDKVHLSHYMYSGRITPEILERACNGLFGLTSFFLCGPPPFMGAVKSMLSASGTPNRNVITEEFSQGKQKGKKHGWPFYVYVVGGAGAMAVSASIMVNDMLKTIPKTILPSQLENTNSKPISSRQDELDALINSLASQLSTGGDSPTLISVNQEVADAEAKIAQITSQPTAVNNKSSGSSGSASSTPTSSSTGSTGSSSSTPTTSTPAPTPTPTPAPAPKCTTSASGVTTCI